MFSISIEQPYHITIYFRSSFIEISILFFIFYFFSFVLLKGSKRCGNVVMRCFNPMFAMDLRLPDRKNQSGRSRYYPVMTTFYNVISSSSSPSFFDSSLYISIGSSLSFMPLKPRTNPPLSLNLVSLTPSNDAIYFKNAR